MTLYADARSERSLVLVPGTMSLTTRVTGLGEVSYESILFSERNGLEVVSRLLQLNYGIMIHREGRGDELLADGAEVKKLLLLREWLGLMSVA